jgi:lysophospholipase L1-like esterase
MTNKDWEVVLISPKPSLARWHLKEKYQELNKALREFADEEPAVKFADVWTPMLAPDGNVKNDLFIDDGLHMNQKDMIYGMKC